MARTKQEFLFATCVTCSLALVFSVVAFSTSGWVVAQVDLVQESIATSDNDLSYGLFTGSYSRRVSTLAQYGLAITCDFGENKCAMLCGDIDLRNQYLQHLLESSIAIDGYAACSRQSATSSGKTVDIQVRANTQNRDGFINCGAWLSTVLFLALACLVGAVNTLLSLWNIVSSPVEVVFNLSGLFVYCCVACACGLIAAIIWGVQFGVTLSDNAGIFDTIITVGTSSGQAALGYSYWLNFIAVLLNGTSAGLIALRQYLINKEPKSIVNLDDRNDNTIILF